MRLNVIGAEMNFANTHLCTGTKKRENSRSVHKITPKKKKKNYKRETQYPYFIFEEAGYKNMKFWKRRGDETSLTGLWSHFGHWIHDKSDIPQSFLTNRWSRSKKNKPHQPVVAHLSSW